MMVALHPGSSVVWEASPSGPIGVDKDRRSLLGCGPDLSRVVRDEHLAMIHFLSTPAWCQAETVKEQFQRLATEWRRDTEVLSSVTDMAMLPAYQQIIGMGKSVLPLVFRELEARRDHWFWALKAITGTDPVPPDDRGDVHRMAAAWIRWAHEHEFL